MNQKLVETMRNFRGNPHDLAPLLFDQLAVAQLWIKSSTPDAVHGDRSMLYCTLADECKAIAVFSSPAEAMAFPLQSPGHSEESIDGGTLWPLLSPIVQDGVVEVIVDPGQDHSIRLNSLCVAELIRILHQPSPSTTDVVEETRQALEALQEIVGAVVLSIGVCEVHQVDRGSGATESIEALRIALSKGDLTCENPTWLRADGNTLTLDVVAYAAVPSPLAGRAISGVAYAADRDVRFQFEGGVELCVTLDPARFSSSEALVWNAPGSLSVVFLEGRVVRARRFRGDPRQHLLP